LIGQLLHIQIFESVVQSPIESGGFSMPMRSCGEEQEVPGMILSYFMHELMALLLFTGTDATGLRAVCASSTMTRSGQSAGRQRGRVALTKSMLTTTCLYL
jgi:hypothetical protein